MKSTLSVAAAVLVLVLQACTLDTPEEVAQVPALQLQVDQQLSLTNLTWTRVNVTGFQEYVILQSHEDIPNSPEPETNSNVTIAARFDDNTVTTFASISTLFTPQTCYKLYTKVNDRFLYSPTVCIDNQAKVLHGFFDRVGYSEETNQLVMFDRINSTLALYNVHTEEVTTSIFENQLSFPFFLMATQSGVTSAFALDQNQQRIRKYNLPGLSLATSETFFNGLIGGEASGPFLFIGSQNTGSSFQVLNNNTMAVLDSRPGFSGQRQYAVFPGDTMVVLEVWETGKRLYRIKGDGKIVSMNEFLDGVSQLSLQNTCDASATHFIGGRFSTIVDMNAITMTSLMDDINSLSIYSRFSEDGSKAIILGQDQQQFFLEIHDITGLPASTLLTRYNLPSANYAGVFLHEDVIHIVGIDFNSSNSKTFIIKIPLAP